MPLVVVTMIQGKSPDYIKKMSDSIYEALVEAYVQQKEETFQIIEQLEPSDLIYARRFGIQGSRSENFVIINIESDARRRAEKEASLSRLSDKLAASARIQVNSRPPRYGGCHEEVEVYRVTDRCDPVKRKVFKARRLAP